MRLIPSPSPFWTSREHMARRRLCDFSRIEQTFPPSLLLLHNQPLRVVRVTMPRDLMCALPLDAPRVPANILLPRGFCCCCKLQTPRTYFLRRYIPIIQQKSVVSIFTGRKSSVQKYIYLGVPEYTARTCACVLVRTSFAICKFERILYKFSS